MKKNLFSRSKALQGLLLAISALGALGLFLMPSSLVSLILIGIFCLTGFHFLIHWKDPSPELTFRPGALILAIGFSVTGLILFPQNMAYTPRMTHLAESLHMGYLPFACLTAGLLILLGFYAFYRLGIWMEVNLCRLLDLPADRQDSVPVTNLILPVSAVGFLATEQTFTPAILSGLILGAAFSLVISLHVGDLLAWSREKKGSRKLIALFTALGILMFRVRSAGGLVLATCAGILSLPFLYFCLTAFFCWMDDLFTRLNTFAGIQKEEKILYTCMFLLAALAVSLLFFRTNAFYGGPHEFDVVYTSDSPTIVGSNAFLSLRHPENDLRQPLFAVFAAPFAGLPYLISRFLPFSQQLSPLLMDYAQIGLLLLANFLLTKIMDLDSRKRMLFMALTGLTYPVLLFFCVMEQYVVGYFWLIFCIYLILKDRVQAEIPLCGAGGTLLTSMILLPALGTHHPIKEFKLWFSQMLTILLSFLLLLLVFGRLDSILNAPDQVIMMLRFSGKDLSLTEKLFQYSGFFHQCLLAPAAAIDFETFGYPSWQLAIPQGYSVSGLVILGICILTAIWGRKDPACKAAGLWLLFSFAVLFILGWGTKENGLVLYSLYFGWTVWVLLFRLADKLESRIPHLTVIISLLGIGSLAIYNLPAMWELVKFACAYYPI